MPVNVSFGASVGGLKAGTDEAKSALGSVLGPVGALKDAFEDLGDGVVDAARAIGSSAVSAFSSLASEVGSLASAGKDFAAGSFFKLLLGGGVVAAGVGGAIDLLGKMNSQMLDLEKNARHVGLALEEFQKYQYVGKVGGFGVDLNSAYDKYKGLLDGSDDELKKFLDANHIAWKSAAGDVFSFNDYLMASSQLIANAGDGVNRFASQTKAADLLGIGKGMVDGWAQGPAALRALGDEAVKVGAILDDNVVHKGAEAEKQWQHTVAQWTSWWRSAISTVTAGIDEMIKRASEAPPLPKDTAVMPWGDVGPEEAEAGRTSGLGRSIERAYNVARDTIDDIQDYGGGDDATAVTDRIASGFKAIGSEAEAAAPKVRAALAATTDAAGAASAMGAVLAQLKAWGVEGYNAAQSFVALAHAKTEATSQPAPAGPKTVFPGDDDDDQKLSGVRAHYRTMIQSADDFYALEKQHLSTALGLHQITYDQETAALLRDLDARKTAEDGFYDAEIAAVKAAGGNYEAIVRLKTKADEQWQLQHDKIVATALEKDTAEWQAALSPVLSSWNSQLRGLLSGTETWSQAMKKILGDLVIQFIEGLERMALAKASLGLAQSLGGGPQSMIASMFGGGQSAGQTANTTAMTTLTASINALNGALTGHAVAVGTNTAATATDTAATAAGATATTANTGGLLANTAGLFSHLGAVLANTLAIIPNTLATILNTAAEAIKSLMPFAQGAWEVPATMPALIHKGEMIVPAEGGHANAMRALLGGLSVPKFELGTNMIMGGGLAIVHPGESIIPAARGSGPFTGAGFGGGNGVTRGDMSGLLADHRDDMRQMMASHRAVMGGLESEIRTLRRQLRR